MESINTESNIELSDTQTLINPVIIENVPDNLTLISQNDSEKVYNHTLPDGRKMSGVLTDTIELCPIFKGMPAQKAIETIQKYDAAQRAIERGKAVRESSQLSEKNLKIIKETSEITSQKRQTNVNTNATEKSYNITENHKPNKIIITEKVALIQHNILYNQMATPVQPQESTTILTKQLIETERYSGKIVPDTKPESFITIIPETIPNTLATSAETNNPEDPLPKPIKSFTPSPTKPFNPDITNQDTYFQNPKTTAKQETIWNDEIIDTYNKLGLLNESQTLQESISIPLGDYSDMENPESTIKIENSLNQTKNVFEIFIEENLNSPDVTNSSLNISEISNFLELLKSDSEYLLSDIKTPVGAITLEATNLDTFDSSGDARLLGESSSSSESVMQIQNLETSLIKLAQLLKDQPDNETIADIVLTLNRIDTAMSYSAINQDKDNHNTQLSPALVKELLQLLGFLGYENPQKTLLEFVSKYNFETMVQAINYLHQLAHSGQRHEVLKIINNNPLNIIEPIAVRLGQAILKLLKSNLQNLQLTAKNP